MRRLALTEVYIFIRMNNVLINVPVTSLYVAQLLGAEVFLLALCIFYASSFSRYITIFYAPFLLGFHYFSSGEIGSLWCFATIHSLSNRCRRFRVKLPTSLVGLPLNLRTSPARACCVRDWWSCCLLVSGCDVPRTGLACFPEMGSRATDILVTSRRYVTTTALTHNCFPYRVS